VRRPIGVSRRFRDGDEGGAGKLREGAAEA